VYKLRAGFDVVTMNFYASGGSIFGILKGVVFHISIFQKYSNLMFETGAVAGKVAHEAR